MFDETIAQLQNYDIDFISLTFLSNFHKLWNYRTNYGIKSIKILNNSLSVGTLLLILSLFSFMADYLHKDAKLPLRRKKEGIKEMEKCKSECSSKHYRDYTRTSSPRKLLLHLLLTSVSFHLLKVTIFSLAGVCLSRHLDNHPYLPSKLNNGNSRYDYCIDFHCENVYFRISFNKEIIILISRIKFSI